MTGRLRPSAESQGQAEAERFRREHNLGVQPLGDLVASIEQATGIDVAVLDAGPDEHGLTIRDPARDAAVIAVARTQRPMRQRSSLAHELAHVLFADWAAAPDGGWSERSPQEVRADAFARHLLIPVAGLREFLDTPETVDRATLSAVSQRFLVSPAIAAIALHQAGYITDATKGEWMSLTTVRVAARFGWLDQYRALQADSDRRRAPQRLLARAIRGYLDHVVSAQTIATLRGMDVDTVEAELRDAGVEPGELPIAWAAPEDLPAVDVDLSDLDDDPAKDASG